jgi:Fe-S cluster assembly protein SufD
MSVVLPKTQAEQALIAQFESLAGALPGDARVRTSRKAAIGAFAASGLPHRRVEAWKYTDLRAAMKDALPPTTGPAPQIEKARLSLALGPLDALDATCIVLVDGAYVATSTDASDTPGLTVTPMREALSQPEFWAMHGDGLALFASHPIIALNTAFQRDGAAIVVARTLLKPIHIVHVATAVAPAAITSRNIVLVAPEADVTLLETHVSLGEAACQTNTLTHISIGKGARVGHVKAAVENGASLHLSTWIADVAADAAYNAFQLSAGASLVRNEIFLTFKGPGASADLSGAMLGRGRDHVDTTLIADHAVPGCTSRELFKSVLDGQARAVFQGKLIVRPDAQKTDAKQMAQALLLSEDAEFDSKPELEIYADDVACGHGSTSGQIDDDLLFYLRSRGVPETEARSLLVTAFIGEALEKIGNEDVRAVFATTTEQWLKRA